MSNYFEMFNIYESSIEDYNSSLMFPYDSKLTKKFTIDITNINSDVINANTNIIWLVNDPFASKKEYLSSSILDIIEHSFSYAGLYTIDIFLICDNHKLHLKKQFEINDGYDQVLITPVPSLYFSNQVISMYYYNTNGKVYYTTDGSDPRTSKTSQLYISPFEISTSVNVKYSLMYNDNFGDIYEANYTLQTQQNVVSISPTGSKYTENIFVTLTYDTSYIDKCFYQINGTEWFEYTVPFELSKNSLVSYYAINSIGSAYPVQTKWYQIDKLTPLLTISPSGGTIYNTLTITLTPNKSETIVSYSISGNNWQTYSTPINVIDLFTISDDAAEYNIPLLAKITDSYNRETNYNINYNLIVDHNPPVLYFINTPAVQTTDRTALFKFAINEDSELSIREATVDIKLNNDNYEVYGECLNGVVYQYYVFGLIPGYQTIYFRLQDKAGNTIEQQFNWQVLPVNPVILTEGGDTITTEGGYTIVGDQEV